MIFLGVPPPSKALWKVETKNFYVSTNGSVGRDGVALSPVASRPQALNRSYENPSPWEGGAARGSVGWDFEAICLTNRPSKRGRESSNKGSIANAGQPLLSDFVTKTGINNCSGIPLINILLFFPGL